MALAAGRGCMHRMFVRDMSVDDRRGELSSPDFANLSMRQVQDREENESTLHPRRSYP
jgi:hypothetical protein